MSEWKFCSVHDWESIGRQGMYRCVDCSASGYSRGITNPLTGMVTFESEISPYKCPVCGGCTFEKNKNCPNCEDKKDNGSSKKKMKNFSDIQVEILETLESGEVRAPLERSWVGAITPLKHRGLVKRTQIIEWSITDDGREILKDIKE